MERAWLIFTCRYYFISVWNNDIHRILEMKWHAVTMAQKMPRDLSSVGFQTFSKFFELSELLSTMKQWNVVESSPNFDPSNHNPPQSLGIVSYIILSSIHQVEIEETKRDESDESLSVGLVEQFWSSKYLVSCFHWYQQDFYCWLKKFNYTTKVQFYN